MVARFVSASLGLLAFAVTAVSGLLARNPVEVTLSRCIFAVVVFCALGFVLGSAAQRVVGEYESQREAQIRERLAAELAAKREAGLGEREGEAAVDGGGISSVS